MTRKKKEERREKREVWAYGKEMVYEDGFDRWLQVGMGAYFLSQLWRNQKHLDGGNYKQ